MSIGARIKALREARGWDQKQLAHRAGVHPSTISLAERDGRTGLRPKTLLKIARALDTTVGHLLGEETAPTVVQETTQPYETQADQYRRAIELAIEHGIGPDQLFDLIKRNIARV